VLSDIGFSIETSGLLQDIDMLKDEMESATAVSSLAVGAVMAATTSVSVGYVLWLIRAGSLLSTLLAQMPAWTLVDPLPVLTFLDDSEESRKRRSGDDEESLESLIQAKEAPAASQ
jgi:hypothetical protein